MQSKALRWLRENWFNILGTSAIVITVAMIMREAAR